MSDTRNGGGLFYGWTLVGVLSLILFNTAGTGLYVFPVFIDSLQHEFGWTMAQISYGVALWAIMFGFFSPVMGALLARFGIRNIMLVGAALASLAHLGMATLINSLWWLYATLAIAAISTTAVTMIPAQTLVTNWFNRYRGRAMAITLVGIGAGGFALPPLNAYLIQVMGWRNVWYVAIAILWVFVIPLIFIFIRSKPSDMGLLPDGAGGNGDADGPAVELSGLPVKRAIRTPTFALLMGVFIFQLMGGAPLGIHFVPFVNQELEFTPQTAAMFLGCTVGCSIIGRLLFGWLADRWHPTALVFIASALLATGPVILEIVFVRMGLRNANLFWCYSIPYGLGIGAGAVTFPILVSRCFGELNFSKILGIMMSGFAIGIILSVPVAGKIFDVTGSYEYMLIGCSAAYILSALLVLFVRPGRYRDEYVTEG